MRGILPNSIHNAFQNETAHDLSYPDFTVFTRHIGNLCTINLYMCCCAWLINSNLEIISLVQQTSDQYGDHSIQSLGLLWKGHKKSE